MGEDYKNGWVPERGFLADAGMGVLRITLLFGSAAIALALVATAALDRSIGDQASRGLDMTATGSISRSSAYTVRRSVLQKSPDAVCIIRGNGTRTGDC